MALVSSRWNSVLETVSSTFGMACTEIFSCTARGIVFGGCNSESEFAVRVSTFEPHSSSLDFGSILASATARNDDCIGLVPMLAPERISCVGDNGQVTDYSVEISEKINFGGDGRSVSLFDFLFETNSDMTENTMLMGLMYLRDVASGLSTMHRNGFCHMDVSLENIVLSATEAFLIDFESVTKVEFGKKSETVRSDITVPVKTAYCPIEHFFSRDTDGVSISDYDVWAWGVSLFITLFGDYLFVPTSAGSHPPMDDISLFFSRGFEAFMRERRPEIYEMISHSENPLVESCWDLLKQIFVCPTLETRPDGSVCWVAHERPTASEILTHPIWEAVDKEFETFAGFSALE